MQHQDRKHERNFFKNNLEYEQFIECLLEKSPKSFNNI